jgi:hypothetical protein
MRKQVGLVALGAALGASVVGVVATRARRSASRDTPSASPNAAVRAGSSPGWERYRPEGAVPSSDPRRNSETR